MIRKHDARHHPERKAAGAVQGLDRPVGVVHVRGVVAAVRVSQHPASRVEYTVEHRHEQVQRILCAQHLVGLGETRPGVGVVCSQITQVGARHGHEECRRHALARDVRDHQPDAPVGQLDEIIEIPAHGGRRNHARRPIAARRRREGRRQNRHLQRPRDLELGFDLRLRPFQRGILVGELAGALGDGRFQDVRLKLQHTQQSQPSQQAQPARIETSQEEGSDRKQVHQPVEADDEGALFRRCHDAQQILEREHANHDDLFDAQRAGGPPGESWNRLHADRCDAQHDQREDEVLKGARVPSSGQQEQFRQSPHRGRQGLSRPPSGRHAHRPA